MQIDNTGLYFRNQLGTRLHNVAHTASASCNLRRALRRALYNSSRLGPRAVPHYLINNNKLIPSSARARDTAFAMRSRASEPYPTARAFHTFTKEVNYTPQWHSLIIIN